MIYFDNAATSGKKPQEVINAMNFALKNLCANPGRSGHLPSQNASFVVYDARKSAADFFGGDGPENVIFTNNCTASINYVLKGVLSQGDHIVISDLEHNAVMRPLISMNIDFSVAKVDLNDDEQTVKNFKKLIKQNTKIIFCTAASNVIGKILPIEKIGKLCKKEGIYFGVDAAQTAGVLPIDMIKMNIDFLCVAAHKGLYCPMGLGILIARKQIYKTIIEGGTGSDSINFAQPTVLPEMLESGTVNLPAIATVKPGINFVKKHINCILNYELGLVRHLYNELKKTKAIFYTNPNNENYVPVLCFNIKNCNSDDFAAFLSKKGFALRAGLHCAPMAHKKIGTINSGALRFSPSVFNKYVEVEALVKEIKKY